MDATSIFIIVVATVLALVFKFVLYKKIQRWMDQDLMKGLAGDNKEKLQFLQEKYATLVQSKVSRKEYPERLNGFAAEFEQNR